MAESQVTVEAEEIQKPGRDVYDIVMRALIGMLINFVIGRLKKKQGLKKERKKAGRQIEKLAKKGKEIPEELRKEAASGLSRRKKKKHARKAGKARKKKRLWIIVAIAIAVALVVKSTKK